MQYHKIKIGFSSPRGWFVPLSWAIKVFQGWMGASHTYISYTSPSGIPMVYQASGEMNNFMALHQFKKIAKIELEYEVELTKHEYDMLMWKFDIMAGTPYSTSQLVGILLKRLIGVNPFKNGRKAAICTEVVARMLQDQGYIIDEVEELTPKQIYDICKRDLNGNS